MNTSVFTYWPSCWALAIYVLRTLIDLVVLRHSFSPQMFSDKIKTFGTDLYWIGVIIWGTILIKKDPNLQLFNYFDPNPHMRLLLVVLLIIGAIIITVLKRIEESITAANAIGIQKWTRNFGVCILVGIMIVLGVLNFSTVFFMMGLS